MNPSGRVFGTGSAEALQEHSKVDANVENLDAPSVPEPGNAHRKKSIENDRLKLLQKQTETQEKLLAVSESIQKSFSEIARYSRKNYDLNREHLDLLKAKEKRKEKENIEKNLRHKDLLEAKLKKLKCQLKSLQK